MTTIYSISFLFLSSSFPYSLLFLIFPSFLSVEETGKGKRESQEKERRGRGKEKERKESLLLSSSLALLFFTFYFPFSPFFFPLFALFSLADATGMMSHVVFSNIAKPSLRNGSAQPLFFVEGSVWIIPLHVCLSCLPFHAIQSEFDRLFDEKARIELR